MRFREILLVVVTITCLHVLFFNNTVVENEHGSNKVTIPVPKLNVNLNRPTLMKNTNTDLVEVKLFNNITTQQTQKLRVSLSALMVESRSDRRVSLSDQI
jgi:hypothetical protein